jgi:hypothetical protein
MKSELMNTHFSPPLSGTRAADDGLSTIIAFLRKLASDRYFGSVQFSFQSGHVVNIRQEQSLKPQDVSNLVANSKGISDALKSN